MQKERADPGSGMKKQKKKWKSRALVFIAAVCRLGPSVCPSAPAPPSLAADGGGKRGRRGGEV